VHELLGGVVGRLVEGQVGVGGQQVDQAAALPGLLEPGLPLLGGDLQRRLGRRRHRDAETGLLLRLPEVPVVLLHRGDLVGAEGAVAGGERVRRRALEDREVGRLLGDHRDRLHPGGPGADEADPEPGEVHALVRPVRGVVGGALERVQARDLRQLRRGQAAGRHHEEPGRHRVAVLRADLPAARLLVVLRSGDPGAEDDVLAQVEPVGHVLRVPEDLRLGGVALLPLELLLQRRVEGVRVREALHVHAGTGVPVPVPGPPDVGAGLEHDRRQAQTTQLVQQVHAGEPGSHHDDVDGRRDGTGVGLRIGDGSGHGRPPAVQGWVPGRRRSGRGRRARPGVECPAGRTCSAARTAAGSEHGRCR
jgi:hypothetical protein